MRHPVVEGLLTFIHDTAKFEDAYNTSAKARAAMPSRHTRRYEMRFRWHAQCSHRNAKARDYEDSTISFALYRQNVDVVPRGYNAVIGQFGTYFPPTSHDIYMPYFAGALRHIDGASRLVDARGFYLRTPMI